MAETPTPTPVEPQGFAARLSQFPLRILGWAGTSRLRMVLCGALGVLIASCVFACWSYLAHLAVDKREPASLAMALFALDEGRLEDARAIVGQMQNEPRPEMFGGALYVLGALKVAEAQEARSEDRQESTYVVAARYLQRARELGVPALREKHAKFLLGKSLILSGQSREGILLLEQLLEDGGSTDPEIHPLLVVAYLNSPHPDLAAALHHSERTLVEVDLTEQARAAELIRRATIQVDMGKVDEAQQTLALVAGDPEGSQTLLEGRIALARATQLAAASPERSELLDRALRLFQKVESDDKLGGELTRRAMYWMGRCLVAQENPFQAREQFDRLSKLYPDTPEGIAAQLEEAHLERDADRVDRAIAGYRAVLESIGDPEDYVNRLLPLPALRKEVRRAYEQFLDEERFEQAQSLADHLNPVFSPIQCTQLRANTQEVWGESLLRSEEGGSPRGTPLGLRQARYHLRAAGRAYEDLARLRYASRHFPTDLWKASENYFRGQSYSEAARTLEEYMRHEPRRLNGLALLRLGQCRLAANQPRLAADAFLECIEAYPRDAVVFQARLECARAFKHQNRLSDAEALLQTNLTGDTLTPSSYEWRDSLFELGDLLYQSGRYEEAIAALEEAVGRYPESERAILAKYTVARANHAASEEPAANLLVAKTENERQKNRALMTEYLEEALAAYMSVQRTLSLNGHTEASPLHRYLLRNCYMMQGAVLYELRRWEEAAKAFSNVSTLYQNDPFVLEIYVQIANCWRRLDQPIKARGTISQARLALDRMPPSVDFRVATNFTRDQWQYVLDQMVEW
jgi:TolA-binding protein